VQGSEVRPRGPVEGRGAQPDVTGAQPNAGGRFGLRLALWYAVVFVASSLAITLLTYTLLASSLAERDRQIVVSTLREYSARYAGGGIGALARAVDLEQRSGRHERLFVRVVSGASEILFASIPPEWSDFDLSQLRERSGGAWGQAPSGSGARLEVASARLIDGTILQVGKSTESRDGLLARFRTVALLVSIAIVLVGLGGGFLVTRSTLQPINGLIRAVSRIIATGRTDARVPVREDRDAIDELSALFNGMLDRITTLIDGMGQALDNVAHDLRTPMTRLRGIAERALESGDAAAQREALGTCLEESDRILAMLDTLMDISEAETGTMRLTRSEVPLDTLVREAVDVYEDVAEEKRISVATTVEPGLTVSADRDRLRQVLANLLDNAIKYTPPGGHVTVNAAREDLAVRIAVADTGAGISGHDLPRIWERLYRGDQSRAERGLGLGLSLVRAIVSAHNGTVEVASEPGRGSTFTVRLPLSPSPPPLGNLPATNRA
jgi:signal transduction histidine kinase